MSLNILIVPDKFKGTLDAGQAGRAIARGWSQARLHDRLKLLPASDGGDGFGAVMGELLGARIQRCRTMDAAHRACTVHWWWIPKTKTAVIESARIVGLGMLPPGKFHPFDLDTFGLGAVLRAAVAKRARRCIIGIGGSATNDGGFGLARALGWEFLDRDGNLIPRWTGLGALSNIRPPARRQWFEEFIVAVDVQNPLLGARGATRIYGPQKGLRAEDIQPAELCLRRLATVFKKIFDRDFTRAGGSGAAGGLGFGLLAFAGAKATPGFELFAREARLDGRLGRMDLVITGEGRLDDSSLMGKGVGQIARRCRQLKIPCLALAGIVDKSAKAQPFFQQAHGLSDLTTIANAQSKSAYWLQKLARQTAESWNCPPAATSRPKRLGANSR